MKLNNFDYLRTRVRLSNMQRFFVSESLNDKLSIVLPDSIKHQCERVLRYQEGQIIMLVDHSNGEAEASIHIEKDVWSARILKYRIIEPNSIQITLIQALIRKEKWEYVLQKATELGVTRIVPLVCSRNVVKWESGELDHKLSRYRKIIQEAAEQSHRTSLPQLKEPISIDELEHYKSDLNFVAYENEKTRALKHSLSSCSSVSLVIGPEGGLSAEEHAKIESFGFESVHLGSRILRAETAGLVGITVIQTLCEP